MAQHLFLENLLNGQAVEWKTVEEIFHLKNGYTPSKSQKEYWENGTVPWFRMEDIRENGQVLDDALQKVNQSAVKGGKLFPANSIIVATSATIGEHALITVPYLANQRFTNLSIKEEFFDKFDIKFVFYYCFLLCDWCKKNTTLSSFASVDMVGFRKFPFPIPPLSAQTEIVRKLDLMTSLIDELKNELNLRQKQYQYYLNKFLTPDAEAVQSLATASDSERQRATASDSGWQWYGRLWVRLLNIPKIVSMPMNLIKIATLALITCYKTVQAKHHQIMFQPMAG